MACDTCDHTMKYIYDDAFWCPRCGSIRIDGVPEVERPMLVNRARVLLECNAATDGLRNTARRIGVFESIYTPEERPAESET